MEIMSIQCSLVNPPPSVQSVVWRYNEFGDKLRDIENQTGFWDYGCFIPPPIKKEICFTYIKTI
jgi:hypothetical protein